MYRRTKRSTPQDAESIEKRIQEKEQELEQLQDQSAEMEADLQVIAQSEMPIDAEQVVKKNINGLKTYNELKDTALSLMALIADQRQMRLKDVMAEVGVEPDADQ